LGIQVTRRAPFALGLIILAVAAATVLGAVCFRALRRRSDVAQQSRTVAVMQTLATLLERHHERDGIYPAAPGERTTRNESGQPQMTGRWVEPAIWPVTEAQTLDRLLPVLNAKYHDALLERDAWGRRFLYGVSEDGQHYTLVSLGQDGRLDPSHDEEFPLGDVCRDLVIVEGALFASGPDGLHLHFRGLRQGQTDRGR
jgi:hypothetical protein